MKLSNVFGIALLIVGVVGCSSEPQPSTLGDGIVTNSIALSDTKTSNNSSLDEECTQYRQMEDGSYACLVTDSKTNNNSMFWYFMGKRFGSYDTMIASKEYKANNLLNGTNNKSKSSDSNSYDNKATKPSNSNKTKTSNTKSSTKRTSSSRSRRR